MNNTIHHWIAKDDIPLFAQSWIPEQPAKATLCLIHGLGEHSQRYGSHFARSFTDSGYAVSALDLRGHGKSGGPRGHVPSFESYLDDIEILLEKAANQFPGKPIFLYGHSLGGLLVLNYALRRKTPLAGVIATGPGLRTAIQEQKFKLLLANVIGSLLPTLPFSSGLVIEDLTKDSKVVSEYKKDPLIHNKVTAGFGKLLPPAIQYAFEHASEFPVPLLLMHGSEDRVAYPKGSLEYASLLDGRCTLKLWEGCYHEIHNELVKDQVLAYTVAWMDERLLIK